MVTLEEHMSYTVNAQSHVRGFAVRILSVPVKSRHGAGTMAQRSLYLDYWLRVHYDHDKGQNPLHQFPRGKSTT